MGFILRKIVDRSQHSQAIQITWMDLCSCGSHQSMAFHIDTLRALVTVWTWLAFCNASVLLHLVKTHFTEYHFMFIEINSCDEAEVCLASPWAVCARQSGHTWQWPQDGHWKHWRWGRAPPAVCPMSLDNLFHTLWLSFLTCKMGPQVNMCKSLNTVPGTLQVLG